MELLSSRTQRRHVHRVAAQHSEKCDVLLDFSKGILGSWICHGSFKINVEKVLEILSCAAVAGERVVHDAEGALALRPALDLGKVDVSERESRQHFEEHARGLLVRKDDARLEWAVGSRDDGLPGEHDKARNVASVVLDTLHQDLHAVDLSGSGTGYGSRVCEIMGSNELGGACSVVHGLPADVEAHACERILTLC